jgi:hypothetical protein
MRATEVGCASARVNGRDKDGRRWPNDDEVIVARSGDKSGRCWPSDDGAGRRQADDDDSGRH